MQRNAFSHAIPDITLYTRDYVHDINNNAKVENKFRELFISLPSVENETARL
jgi:hypothetical protein